MGVQNTILIVDDEPHIRLLIEQTLEDLEDEGIDLLSSGDAEEALRLIRTAQPQLVFLDVMMPKMDGFEICRRVKKDWGLTEVYIIILTAKGQSYDRQEGEAAGADLYMTKPFDPDVLLQKAREVLELP
jgi:DNA-binding response OmpR family regulator